MNDYNEEYKTKWKLKVRKCQKWVENANQTQLKPIIWYSSWKLPQKWGNRPKKEEIYQQTENLKLFLKTGNWPKKKRKRTQKKPGNELNVNIAETNPKYSEIPQKRRKLSDFVLRRFHSTDLEWSFLNLASRLIS